MISTGSNKIFNGHLHPSLNATESKAWIYLKNIDMDLSQIKKPLQPDFILRDGRRVEIKRVAEYFTKNGFLYEFIEFTSNQWKKFKGSDLIFIFRRFETEPVLKIRFKDLKSIYYLGKHRRFTKHKIIFLSQINRFVQDKLEEKMQRDE